MSKQRRKQGLWKVYKDTRPFGAPRNYNEVESYAETVRALYPESQIDVVRVK
jgi:hypothetical protein